MRDRHRCVAPRVRAGGRSVVVHRGDLQLPPRRAARLAPGPCSPAARPSGARASEREAAASLPETRHRLRRRRRSASRRPAASLRPPHDGGAEARNRALWLRWPAAPARRLAISAAPAPVRRSMLERSAARAASSSRSSASPRSVGVVRYAIRQRRAGRNERRRLRCVVLARRGLLSGASPPAAPAPRASR